MAPDPSTEPRAADASGRFAWIASLFATVIIGGFVLVLWAINSGSARDVAASPYHLPLYLGLAALWIFCAARVVRASRRGEGWRQALPNGYGVLAVGAATALAGLLLDVGWREGVGFAFGIEEGFGPSRVVLVAALGMIAIAPLRARLSGADVPWIPVALSAAFTLAALGWPGGFHPAETAWLAVDPDLPEFRADVWVMDADGSHQTRLIEASAETNLGYVSWGPDGERIAYTTFSSPGEGTAITHAEVWLADDEGREATAVGAAGEWRWIPRLTPDNEWVLFTQEASGGPWMEEGPVGPGAAAGPQGPLSIPLPNADIWRMASDGDGTPERLTDAAGDDRAPVPSPDGAQILFDSTRDGNTEVYVMDADGGNPTRLTVDSGEDWGAVWSPDGSRIAFNSSRSGDMEIHVMDADGGNVQQLTFDRGFNTSPTWSPDGARIAFVTRGPDGYGQIRSMASGGGDQRDLSRSPSSDDQVWTGGWGLDGRIAFTRILAPTPEATALARLDFGTAAMVLSVILIAVVVVLLARTDPPPGAFLLALGLATALAAAPTGDWRFVAAGLAAGAAADVSIRLAGARTGPKIAAASASATFVLASAAAALATTGLEWTPTLALGTALACGALGWALGALAEGPSPTIAESPP